MSRTTRTLHGPENERIKRRYLTYLKQARQKSEPTIDAVAEALARFEDGNGHRDFKLFHVEQAMAFKRKLAESRNARTSCPLSKATIYSTLLHLKRFFQWLSEQSGHRSLKYSDADYFNPSEKDARVATARRETAYPTVDQVKQVIGIMPAGTDVERRDRALMAFTLLTAARNGALISLKLKHINLADGFVEQDAREVNTKNSKSFRTYFVPIGSEVLQVVEEWIAFLRNERAWAENDPLFPATQTELGPDNLFRVVGLKCQHWLTTTPVREIFRAAFTSAGLPYFNPHALRKTLVAFGQKTCQTPEHFKAFSQNIGHESILTTFGSYGAVQVQRQGEIIRGLVQAEAPRDLADQIADKLAARFAASGILTRP